MRPVSRALLSVSDKSRLVAQAQALAELGVELVSTGGTKRAIAEAGLAVSDVAELTGFPEMMDGRVKTLHPMVHGGLLGERDLDSHVAAMSEHDIAPIDLLIVNLYPFEDAVASGADYETCVENIDIGGPAMIRAGAKNHAHVAVCVDADDVDAVIEQLRAHDGQTSGTLRQRLAHKAFSRTAHYDASIGNWFARQRGDQSPPFRTQGARLRQTLRYGENPHQSAAFYTDGSNRPGVATAEQVQGKALSYNNINDTDAAYELVAEFGDARPAPEGQGARPTVAIVKHANPCGVATAADFSTAYRDALACDPVSAFGGIVALNGLLDEETAKEIVKVFTEVVIAPDATDAAVAVFAKKKNLRLLLAGGLPDPAKASLTYRNVAGGVLVQDRDSGHASEADFKVVTKRAPTDAELADLRMAWKVAKHVKSNAIVYVKDGATAGIGAGQMSRVDAARIAARKAQDAAEDAGWDKPRTVGSVVSSDAFFPFPDGMLAAAKAGATAVIQPGGSIRDQDVIDAADEAGLAMVFTGMRHFRH
ncbi:bifunctional phosphoribosylaminoimidazolecarboxamide formyltransferase/IMP cyclohydrolase [uncultured Algimonas sp.]|uniref:bifunctional phosphoribosylaminoimidazolecarboxamide formyltransferase/IMP cyclohydrolase n=1 Tax=uncultured Algimonas sp. TaxID=1547920 RepID=UPI00262B64C9|nr:bifunctional phosphoribosylaminoimidazolecarboxamide formyltransferase/IMP cyclohydrolase [uncultured Algimonas sp.]